MWVGCFTDSKPTPDDLIRKVSLPGLPVELADGNKWTVPIVQVYDQQAQPVSLLPCKADLDDEGRITRGEVIAKHRLLAEACDSFFEQWSLTAIIEIEQGKDSWSWEYDPTEVAVQATTVMGANYRIGLVETILLELFTLGTENHQAVEVLQAACDCGLAMALLQKKRDMRSPGADEACES